MTDVQRQTGTRNLSDGSVPPPDGTGDVYLAYSGDRLVAALVDGDDLDDSRMELDRWRRLGRGIRRVSRAEFRAMNLGASPGPLAQWERQA